MRRCTPKVFTRHTKRALPPAFSRSRPSDASSPRIPAGARTAGLQACRGRWAARGRPWTIRIRWACAVRCWRAQRGPAIRRVKSGCVGSACQKTLGVLRARPFRDGPLRRGRVPGTLPRVDSSRNYTLLPLISILLPQSYTLLHAASDAKVCSFTAKEHTFSAHWRYVCSFAFLARWPRTSAHWSLK